MLTVGHCAADGEGRLSSGSYQLTVDIDVEVVDARHLAVGDVVNLQAVARVRALAVPYGEVLRCFGQFDVGKEPVVARGIVERFQQLEVVDVLSCLGD